MINPNPITKVTRDDIGRPVSYAAVGMAIPEKGTIVAMASVPDRVFVLYGKEGPGQLTHLYDLQWGHHNELWWDEDERLREVAKIKAKRQQS